MNTTTPGRTAPCGLNHSPIRREESDTPQTEAPWLPKSMVGGDIIQNTSWRVSAVLTHLHAASAEITVSKLCFGIDVLDDWLTRPGPQLNVSDGLHHATMTSGVVAACDFGGFSVALTEVGRASTTRREVTLSATPRFEITSNGGGHTLESLLQDVVQPLCDLIAFASCQPALPSALLLEFPDPGPVEFARPIAFISPTTGQESPSKNLHPLDVPVPWSWWGDQFSDVLRNWFTNYRRWKPILERLLLPPRTPHMYVEDRLLTAAVAAEATYKLNHPPTVGPTEHSARVDVVVESAPADLKDWVKGALADRNGVSFRRKVDVLLDTTGAMGARLKQQAPDLGKRLASARGSTAQESSPPPPSSTTSP